MKAAWTNEEKYIHFWKVEITDAWLDGLLEYYQLYSKRVWLILLEEKLRRVENEISI